METSDEKIPKFIVHMILYKNVEMMIAFGKFENKPPCVAIKWFHNLKNVENTGHNSWLCMPSEKAFTEKFVKGLIDSRNLRI